MKKSRRGRVKNTVNHVRREELEGVGKGLVIIDVKLIIHVYIEAVMTL